MSLSFSFFFFSNTKFIEIRSICLLCQRCSEDNRNNRYWNVYNEVHLECTTWKRSMLPRYTVPNLLQARFHAHTQLRVTSVQYGHAINVGTVPWPQAWVKKGMNYAVMRFLHHASNNGLPLSRWMDSRSMRGTRLWVQRPLHCTSSMEIHIEWVLLMQPQQNQRTDS